jgi:hypothetical protein
MVTTLTREEWNRGPETPLQLMGSSDTRMRPKQEGKPRSESMGNLREEDSISLKRKYFTVFEAELYDFLFCAHEIHIDFTPEKYVSICSDIQAALKAFQAIKTVKQCPRALNDISTHHFVGLFRVLEHSGIRRNKTADELPTEVTVFQFAGSELALGVPR